MIIKLIIKLIFKLTFILDLLDRNNRKCRMEFNETSSKPIELFKAIANLFIVYLNYVNSQFLSKQVNQVHHETEYPE